MPTTQRLAMTLAFLAAVPVAGCSLTPNPIPDAQIKEQAAARLERFAGVVTPVNGTLTLQDAVARAVNFNLDQRVEMYETAIRAAELGASNAAMLPGLVASAARTGRDSPLGSLSYNLVTNTQNFGYSTSQDQRARTADMAFSWNILDFGLSYVRARQAADKVLIAQENRRRVTHKLIEELRTAYWRAYTADIMRAKLRTIELRVNTALSTNRVQADERTTSPITALTYRRELIEIRRTLQELQRDLASAKHQLAALINERPDANFKLAPPKSGSAPSFASAKSDALIAMAMEKRPEFKEIAYRRRINGQELDAALLELLPGIQLYAGTNSDTNSYLLHDHWVNWGARASWNVMRLFQYPARRDVIETQDAALAQRDLALTMAVMTQIHVSRSRIAVIERERKTARAYSETQNELLGHIRSEFKTDRISEQTLLREELNAVVGTIRAHLAEASLQSAYAQLQAAVGIDPPDYATTNQPLEIVGNAAAWRPTLIRTSANE